MWANQLCPTVGKGATVQSIHASFGLRLSSHQANPIYAELKRKYDPSRLSSRRLGKFLPRRFFLVARGETTGGLPLLGTEKGFDGKIPQGDGEIILFTGGGVGDDDFAGDGDSQYHQISG